MFFFAGEGAFGTVYGGEAGVSEFGWVPVAVKTLKSGFTTEDKIDFLSEADNMKRFDHKNVIKLFGVITRENPLCTLMEYCLYGDLKNFLLARRHMAYSNCEGKSVTLLPNHIPETFSCHRIGGRESETPDQHGVGHSARSQLPGRIKVRSPRSSLPELHGERAKDRENWRFRHD